MVTDTFSPSPVWVLPWYCEVGSCLHRLRLPPQGPKTGIRRTHAQTLVKPRPQIKLFLFEMRISSSLCGQVWPQTPEIKTLLLLLRGAKTHGNCSPLGSRFFIHFWYVCVIHTFSLTVTKYLVKMFVTWGKIYLVMFGISATTSHLHCPNPVAEGHGENLVTSWWLRTRQWLGTGCTFHRCLQRPVTSH